MFFDNKLSLEKKYKIKNFIFSLAWCLLLLQVLVLDSSLPQPPFKITILCMLMLMFCAIFPFDYTLSEIAIIFIGGILTVLICYKTKFNVVLWVYTFIVCSKGISLKAIFKKTLFIYSIFFITCFILSRLGLIDEMIRDNGGTGEIKHSLGMGDANSAHAKLLFIFAIIFTVYYDKMKIWHFILLLLINSIVYKYTICRTSAYIIFFILFVGIFEKLLAPHISKTFYNVLCGLLIGGVFLAILLFTISPFLLYMNPEFDSEFLFKLNDFVTGRINLARSFIDDYGIHPFGTYVVEFFEFENRWRYFDIGFLVLLVQYGYIFFVIYMTGYLALFIKFFKEHKFGIILALSSIMLYMTNENLGTIIFYNFTYFFFRDFIFREKKPTLSTKAPEE